MLTQPGIRLETERDLMVWRESEAKEKEKRWQEQEFSPKRIQEQPTANTMQGHMLEEFEISTPSENAESILLN